MLRDFHPFTSVFAGLLMACLFVIVGGSTCCSVSDEGERTTWALALSQHDNLAAERDVADTVPAQAERPAESLPMPAESEGDDAGLAATLAPPGPQARVVVAPHVDVARSRAIRHPGRGPPTA